VLLELRANPKVLAFALTGMMGEGSLKNRDEIPEPCSWRDTAMGALVTVPREALEALESFRLPAQLDRRLQDLMDRNNEGLLTAVERDELSGLADLSERMALHRAQVHQLLQSSQ
jgi:hypothetical protein